MVVNPGLGDVVLPLTVGTLTALFAAERWGTERIGIAAIMYTLMGRAVGCSRARWSATVHFVNSSGPSRALLTKRTV
jgi:hypothetical protein